MSGPEPRGFDASTLRSWRVWVVFVGLPILGLLIGWDEALRSLRSLTTGRFWSVLALGLSASANGLLLIPAGLVAVVWFDRRGRRRFARMLVVMLLAGLVSGMTGTLLRSLIGRTRPEVPVEQGWYGPRRDGRWILGRHAYGAFPSGHTSMAAGFGLMAFAWGRRIGSCGLAFALAVGWARFHLGAHRASDIWAGLLLAATLVSMMAPRCVPWVRDGFPIRGWPNGWNFLVDRPGRSSDSLADGSAGNR